MKVKDLFNNLGMGQSFSGPVTFLDRVNCKLSKRMRLPDSVLLTMIRESDGAEGHAFLRIRDSVKSKHKELLNWAESSTELDGLTLEEIENVEVPIDFE